jgi:3-deoxy-D-manno-octulosonate 8-phosphate phosphatase (KDO 8-P phosphatase)
MLVNPEEIHLPKHLQDKLKKIKIFLCDIDGILTNGQLYYNSEEVGFIRFFHVYDGYAFKFLKNAGIKIGILSGGESVGIKKRMEPFNIDFMYLGDEDKLKGYEKIKEISKIPDEEILYMGDDIFDMPVLKKVGFSATVQTANYEVKNVCHYITNAPSGMGCVREVADHLRRVQGIIPHEILKSK